MKVLMLFNDYLQAGGERVSVATEVDALRAAGADVRLLAVENHNLQELGPLGKLRTTFPRSQAFDDVSREIATFGPDVVHAQNLFPQLGAGAIRAIGESGIPWIRTIRNYRKGCIAGTFTRDRRPCYDCAGAIKRVPGVVHGCYQGSRVNSAGATNYAYWEARAERENLPAGYVVISDAMRREVSPFLHKSVPVHQVHNGVANVGGIDIGPPVTRTHDVAFVGRLSVEKGVHIVLQLARSLPDVQFVVAGDGELSGHVDEASRTLPNLRHLSGLDHRGAAGVMSQSRLVLVPSQWPEPFGRVAAEAMAYGALPVVSASGGLPEVVAGLPFTSVVPPDDVELWRLEVTALLRSEPAQLADLSRACVSRWEEQFSPPSLARRLLTVYQTVTTGTEG